MIITVTLNPLLEYRFNFSNKIKFSGLNQHRCNSQNIVAGGKGINVSRQLYNLGIESVAVAFVGGLNGKQLARALSAEKFNSILIRTEAETRIGFVAIDNASNNIESYFGMNSEIAEKDSAQMKTKLEKMIPNCEMIILSGSSSSRFTDDIFPFAIELANKHDKISFVDTYGEHLQSCIDSSPKILHCNIDEIETSLSTSLRDEKSMRDFLFYLYEKGIKQSFLTNGGEEFYSANFDYHYKIFPPKIKSADSTGSGDAFTAGIASGLYNDYVFEDYLRTAVKLGAVNASLIDVCNVTREQLDAFSHDVIVSPVGKILKQVDVAPTI